MGYELLYTNTGQDLRIAIHGKKMQLMVSNGEKTQKSVSYYLETQKV